MAKCRHKPRRFDRDQPLLTARLSTGETIVVDLCSKCRLLYWTSTKEKKP